MAHACGGSGESGSFPPSSYIKERQGLDNNGERVAIQEYHKPNHGGGEVAGTCGDSGEHSGLRSSGGLVMN